MGITNARGNNIEKKDVANIIYGTDIAGKQTTLPVSGTAVESTIPIRGTGGRLTVGAPTDANDAVTKTYADSLACVRIWSGNVGFGTTGSLLINDLQYGDLVTIVYVRDNIRLTVSTIWSTDKEMIVPAETGHPLNSPPAFAGRIRIWNTGMNNYQLRYEYTSMNAPTMWILHPDGLMTLIEIYRQKPKIVA